MARPKKNNADYFPHDNAMRNDDRIRAVRRKFGHTGYSVWNMFLEKLTAAENWMLEYSPQNIELWAGDFEIESEQLKEIIDYFILLKVIQHEAGRIFSTEHIKRFDPLLKKRERDNKRVSDSENTLFTEFPIAKTPEKEVIADENTQSKVKESKVNNIHTPNPSPEIILQPPQGGDGVCVSDKKQEDKKTTVPEPKVFNALKTQIFADVCQYFGYDYQPENELKFLNRWRLIEEFLSRLYARKRLDYFIVQFDCYKKFKDESGQETHSFDSFLNGKWEANNWEKKYRDFTKKRQPPPPVHVRSMNLITRKVKPDKVPPPV